MTLLGRCVPPLEPQCLGYYTYNPKCEASYQIQLGSKVYPAQEATSSQEAFFELLKNAGCHESFSTVALEIFIA